MNILRGNFHSGEATQVYSLEDNTEEIVKRGVKKTTILNGRTGSESKLLA